MRAKFPAHGNRDLRDGPHAPISAMSLDLANLLQTSVLSGGFACWSRSAGLPHVPASLTARVQAKCVERRAIA